MTVADTDGTHGEGGARDSEPRILVERRGHVLLMGLNRPAKRNAADMRMLRELALAYGELERDPELRAGVVYAVGEHFTAGLDLADVSPHLGTGPYGTIDAFPEGGVDPWQLHGDPLSKPIVLAIQGTCLTLGIELALASDYVVAAESASFAQLEVQRGIMPFGGATLRFPQAAGWGAAMRAMLTGERFGAEDAKRMRVVHEITADGAELEAALTVASAFAAAAPLAVQATLRSAKLARSSGAPEAIAALGPALLALARSEDARIGMEAFLSRQAPVFRGR